MELKARERLIVALDVPTMEEAIRIVEELSPEVTFFKVGMRLWMTGRMMDLLEVLRGKEIFLDLKLGADIGATIADTMRVLTKNDAVRFLTLDSNTSLQAIRAAKEARGTLDHPKLLTVPYLSSLDETDFAEMGGDASLLDEHVSKKARAAVDAGCDGVIASGKYIQVMRALFPRPKLVVSPGIRPSGHPQDDHKRSTTPGEAIRLGADYLVVGRPILNRPDQASKLVVVKQIIDEIEAASPTKNSKATGLSGRSEPYDTQSAYCKDSD